MGTARCPRGLRWCRCPGRGRPGTFLIAGLLIVPLLPSPALAAAPPDGPVFVDRAAEVGLDFVHDNGMSGEFYFPEINGGGVAWLDADGDGDLDAYLVQSGPIGPDTGKPPPGDTAPARDLPGDRLFRNDGRRFVDVTGASGLRATGYGMGVAAGDVDGDGDVDLYVANYGPNQLWRNDGDGTFTEIIASAGADDPRWSIGASFLDYDRDGDLDLYVVNYVEFDLERNPRCFTDSSRRDYCGPSAFPPLPDRLLRNRGDGTFEDVSAPSGIARQAGAGLGVVSADFNRDGLPDLYVANDGQANFLWLNQGDGTFRDDALFAGVALNREGTPEASMGVDAGDFDGDGDDDLFMTHLMGESNTLYVNDGSGLFEDRSLEAGLASGSVPYTAFGTAWADIDNDGWLDLFIGNGAVRILEERVRQGDPYPLDQPNQLFWNDRGRRFVEITDRAGEAFREAEVTRGAAFGDMDDDGDLDVLVSNNQGRARLLINRVGQDRAWIGLRVLEGEPARDAIGARVEVVLPGGRSLWRRVRTDGSYASAHDPRVLVGLGERTGGKDVKVEAVRVHWLDGTVETWKGLAAGRYHRLERGTGGTGTPDTAADKTLETTGDLNDSPEDTRNGTPTSNPGEETP